jgi:curved DNA-binding protein CbpA
LHDYYAILGLDADASLESVKIAYRRLARQHHPDFMGSVPPVENASIHARMAQLNEAYAVLSNPRSRREYDDRMRLEHELVTGSAPLRSVGDTGAAVKTAEQVHQPRIRPRHEVDSTVVTQFSEHVREILVGNKAGFSWKRAAFEGFDWGLEAASWLARYSVALRGFSTVDASSAKKFVNYSEMVVERCKPHIRKDYFLFLLPFWQMTEWESISSQIQSFVNGKSRPTPRPTGIILFDIHHNRILRLGASFSDKRFEQLIQAIRTAT